MGLLKLAENIPGVEYIEHRDQLYFTKFKYKITLRLDGNPNHSPKKLKPGSHLSKIDQLREWYAPRKGAGTAVCRKEGSQISVFSNSIAELQAISELDRGSVTPGIVEAIVHPVAGVKVFEREPKHKYRTYFKDARVPREVFDLVMVFLKNNPDVAPSRTLARRFHPDRLKEMVAFQRSFAYFHSAYYLDYDDESKLSYMSLMFGEVIGKHYRLEKRT